MYTRGASKSKDSKEQKKTDPKNSLTKIYDSIKKAAKDMNNLSSADVPEDRTSFDAKGFQNTLNWKMRRNECGSCCCGCLEFCCCAAILIIKIMALFQGNAIAYNSANPFEAASTIDNERNGFDVTLSKLNTLYNLTAQYIQIENQLNALSKSDKKADSQATNQSEYTQPKGVPNPRRGFS